VCAVRGVCAWGVSAWIQRRPTRPDSCKTAELLQTSDYNRVPGYQCQANRNQRARSAVFLCVKHTFVCAHKPTWSTGVGPCAAARSASLPLQASLLPLLLHRLSLLPTTCQHTWCAHRCLLCTTGLPPLSRCLVGYLRESINQRHGDSRERTSNYCALAQGGLTNIPGVYAVEEGKGQGEGQGQVTERGGEWVVRSGRGGGSWGRWQGDRQGCGTRESASEGEEKRE
jgi:hypothetical protein